jgi:hypothetical protein
LSVLRIKIWAWRRNWAKGGVLQRSLSCMSLIACTFVYIIYLTPLSCFCPCVWLDSRSVSS